MGVLRRNIVHQKLHILPLALSVESWGSSVDSVIPSNKLRLANVPIYDTLFNRDEIE